ncbi:MAG: hypothetical protein K2J93_00300, partial [Anaeroplasmataceae bacterium]|nr:hypothetical protein [Anaeroplasmataceae bacterium]
NRNVYERNKPNFELKESLKRSLISSAGKLHSITRIVQSEYGNLKEDLRLLILTDYIKKEALNQVGKDKINHISLVSIFEELRSNTNLNIGCLSGSLVILPIHILPYMEDLGIDKSKYSTSQINDTSYVQLIFKGNNRQKISIISRLFEQGHLQVLIGTQALLGEGWDSPCINSLILASYVGSFMLSNQMRGRAIRSYQNNPNKTANIWHLVTLEPAYIFEDNEIKKLLARLQEDGNQIDSYDFKTLSRRFDCFLGPNYETQEIESGINRISIIKPPFTKNQIEKINEQMLLRSNQREEMSKSWKEVLEYSAKTITESQIPKVCRVPAFTYFNFLALITACFIETLSIQIIVQLIKLGLNTELNIISLIILFLIIFLVAYGSGKLIRFICKHRSPKKSIEGLSNAVLKTFKELDLIHSGAHLKVSSDELDLGIYIHLANSTIHEQNIFNQAIEEMLSPIDNPKFIIIKETPWRKMNYKYSFACPSGIIKKEGVLIFKKHLKNIMGNMKVIYAYNAKGRSIALKCKKSAFISKNQAVITKKQKISKFE